MSTNINCTLSSTLCFNKLYIFKFPHSPFFYRGKKKENLPTNSFYLKTFSYFPLFSFFFFFSLFPSLPGLNFLTSFEKFFWYMTFCLGNSLFLLHFICQICEFPFYVFPLVISRFGSFIQALIELFTMKVR